MLVVGKVLDRGLPCGHSWRSEQLRGSPEPGEARLPPALFPLSPDGSDPAPLLPLPSHYLSLPLHVRLSCSLPSVFLFLLFSSISFLPFPPFLFTVSDLRHQPTTHSWTHVVPSSLKLTSLSLGPHV